MNTDNHDTDKDKEIPLMQRVLDNYILLLVLGTIIYFISYIIWGVVEIEMVQPLPEEIKQNLLNL